jgi:hypothetical protein
VVRIEEPKPTVWTPNATYHFETKTKLAVPVISAETRGNVAGEEGTDETPVTLVMVDGMDQFGEDNVPIRRYAGKHGRPLRQIPEG